MIDLYKERRFGVKLNGGYNDIDFDVDDVYLSRVYYKDYVMNVWMIDDL